MSTPPEPITKAPPTRIISFLAQVLEQEPDYYNRLARPVIYTFSNGRRFVKDLNVYTD